MLNILRLQDFRCCAIWMRLCKPTTGKSYSHALQMRRSSAMSYVYHPLKPGYIRPLEIVPCSEKEESLDCRLQTVQLESRGYDAVSYCWRSSAEQRRVFIGREFPWTLSIILKTPLISLPMPLAPDSELHAINIKLSTTYCLPRRTLQPLGKSSLPGLATLSINLTPSPWMSTGRKTHLVAAAMRQEHACLKLQW
jgi:hypothetical protein